MDFDQLDAQIIALDSRPTFSIHWPWVHSHRPSGVSLLTHNHVPPLRRGSSRGIQTPLYTAWIPAKQIGSPLPFLTDNSIRSVTL